MAQTRREKKSEETGALWLAVMREMLRGSGVAVAVTLLALLACALLVSNGTIGEGMMDRAVLAVCVLGSLTGGLTAVRRIRRSPLPVGLGVGGCLFLLLLITSPTRHKTSYGYGNPASNFDQISNIQFILHLCIPPFH